VEFTARFHATQLNTSAFRCDDVRIAVQFELIDAAHIVDVEIGFLVSLIAFL
jgi:hypothetical protein